MAGHEIGNEILFLSRLGRESFELLFEGAENRKPGFPHGVQHRCGAMLRRNFQLSRYMIPDKLSEKTPVRVEHKIIEANSGADEDLFNSGNFFCLCENIEIFAVVNTQIFAGGRSETAAIAAYAVFPLFFTGRFPKVRRRPADIMNITLEAGEMRELFHFRQNAFFGAGAD